MKPQTSVVPKKPLPLLLFSNYWHRMMGGALVHPDSKIVIPLAPGTITAGDAQASMMRAGHTRWKMRIFLPRKTCPAAIPGTVMAMETNALPAGKSWRDRCAGSACVRRYGCCSRPSKSATGNTTDCLPNPGLITMRRMYPWPVFQCQEKMQEQEPWRGKALRCRLPICLRVVQKANGKN